MKFTKLTTQEFENFIRNKKVHYTQSTAHYEYRNKYQHDAHLVGVKGDNGEVLAACLLTEAPCFKFFKYFYTHRGPVMAYDNDEIVSFFYQNLSTYLKKQRGLYILTDPYLLENIRDAKGNIIETHTNDQFIRVMENLGYQHQGYTVGYSSMSQIRWLSVLDLKDKSEDQLLKEMDYQTRRNIKKTYEMGVEVKTLSIEETERFFKLFRMAEEKHGFKFRELPYFKQLQKMYGKQAQLKLAYIDLKKLLQTYEQRIHELTGALIDVEKALAENPNSKKNKTKYKQLIQQLDSQKKKRIQTQERISTEGELLDLAAAIYLHNDYEVYYLSSGSNPDYNAYMGAYRLQWEMIQFAKQNHIDRYNFYGITGDFSGEAEDYGVQRFKEGFNAHIEEYIGDFIKPIRPLFYRIYKRLRG
ncbi:aminoacyltransferase [Staphylococcus sp. 17KM0847]|uniref:aminoacyltransferase n=1 Tax=Staphylococcus sp. 17KM0847 TaxID=2583989 RepID=UPI0015DCF95F|nr:aminoacyltransferase [Staphylococcus sp. 17KM0847]QLK85690.1 aminoacyltransferase [Staphylococcus sp. 17KM0847]